MKKKILIPTDFSKNAWNAVAYAADLFKDEACTFYILNAYTVTGYSLGDLMVPEPGSDSYEIAKTISENGLEKIRDMLDFRAQNNAHQYETVCMFNDPLSAMMEFVEKKDIDLVVMGTKGASNSRGALFGSNAITAMEKLRNCPVIGVPLDTRFGILKEIVFPTSYKTHYKRKELICLTELAQMHDAHICVVHVDHREALSADQKENQQLLEYCLEGTEYSFHHINGSDPAIGVQHFVESRESNMVAFINKKHTFFGSVFTNPMVKELGMFSKVPLMVLHDLRN
ncbi:MAG: nucleotide-binding universal stress UspA family protein [Flavobacteriales bacterium]|jgi:nucleotide-binding universal stress UspA family protein